jgi:CubicO group peptidase (beta-lactamase class C family)
VFELASVTKVFTTSILGKHSWVDLNVNLPVSPLPPGYDLTPKEQGVTFQQLATFTGGFWWDDPPDYTKGQDFSQDDFVAVVNALDPTNPVGTGFAGPIAGEQSLPTYDYYSNGSTGFLGQILMQMDSKKGRQYPFDANGFSNWIADNLTGPLNMPNTRVHPGGTIATGYKVCSKCATGYKQETPFPWVPWGAAGALRSTAADMVTFLKANICARHILDGAIISNPPCSDFPADVLLGMASATDANTYDPPGTLADATIYVGGCGSQTHQAWAWAILEPPVLNPGNAKPIIYKNGGHPGFSTFIGFNPDKLYGVVILLNTGNIGLINAGLNMIQHTN